MNTIDLNSDERFFLGEAANFEQSLPMLISFVHDQHPRLALPRKFEIAQMLVERLCTAGLMRVIVVKYKEKKQGFFEVVGFEAVPFESLKAVWSNPYLWRSNSENTGGAFLGIPYEGRSCIAFEPTVQGEAMLANERQ
jgi:hypothetical protein